MQRVAAFGILSLLVLSETIASSQRQPQHERANAEQPDCNAYIGSFIFDSIRYQVCTTNKGKVDGTVTYNSGSFHATGQFSDGAPIGIWKFTGPVGSADVNMDTNGGQWWIPMSIFYKAPAQYGAGDECSGRATEQGSFSGGKQTGIWWSWLCQKATGPQYAPGSQEQLAMAMAVYSAGFLNGPAFRYSDDPDLDVRPQQLLTYQHGRVNGPFAVWSYFNSLVPMSVVSGSIAVTADRSPAWTLADPNCTRYDPRSCTGAKPSGTWTFRGPDGVVFGQSQLETAGTGHLTVYLPFGLKYDEGNLVDGVANGTWTFYPYAGAPCAKVSFVNGKETSSAPCKDSAAVAANAPQQHGVIVKFTSPADATLGGVVGVTVNGRVFSQKVPPSASQYDCAGALATEAADAGLKESATFNVVKIYGTTKDLIYASGMGADMTAF